MIQELPTIWFEWEKVDDFTPEKIDKLVGKCGQGYFVEVDVEYLKELLKKHNKMLFLLENEIRKGRKTSTKS